MDKCTYHIKLINQFVNCYKNNKINECLELVSDNIVFISSHNDTLHGKEQFKIYLSKNKLVGSITQPYWSAMDRTYRFDVKNKFLFIKIKTKHLIKFNDNKQIEYYHITYC